jgi:hypothetical protein
MRRAAMVPLVALLLLPARAHAQGRNHLYDKFQLSGSGTLMIYNTTLRIDPENGDGTTIDAERLLGLDPVNVQPRLAGRLRMGRRHELELGFQMARRSADKQLSQEIIIEDDTIGLGADIKARLNTSQAFLNYRYAFTAKENTQIGLAVGLGGILLDEAITVLAGGSVNGEVVTGEFVQEESFIGPTASIGLYGRFRIGDKWFLETDARALYVSVSNITARVIEGGVAFRYFLSPSFGAELGYALGSYKVTLDRDGDLIDLSGQVGYDAQGIRVGFIWTP